MHVYLLGLYLLAFMGAIVWLAPGHAVATFIGLPLIGWASETLYKALF